jgi:hypothetical protein
MMTIDRWNARQVHVFTRYGRRRGTPLTPELVTRLAQRFALKHVRAIADGRRSESARVSSCVCVAPAA